MADARPRLLTDEQRLWFTSMPTDLTQPEIIAHYTLSPDDIHFIQRHHGQTNRLGLAGQLAIAPERFYE